jgi:hypothetical protein
MRLSLGFASVPVGRAVYRRLEPAFTGKVPVYFYEQTVGQAARPTG